MAEFCLECLNRMNDTALDERDVMVSKELNFCEGCGQVKHVVIWRRKKRNKIFWAIFRR